MKLATKVTRMATPTMTVLTRSERPDPLLGAEDVAGWSAGTLEQFLRLGILANADPLASFACDACGFDHVEPVQWVNGPNVRRRAFIACPSVGPVALDTGLLKRWVVRLPVLAQCVAALVGAAGVAVERVPGRVWKLGTLRAGSRAWIGFLAVGLTRPDATAVVESVPELHAANALVFVSSVAPPVGVWSAGRPAAIVSLCDLLSLGPDGLTADAAFLESSLPLPANATPKGPARAFPTPPGTDWGDVSLIVDDLRVVVRVGEVAQTFTFAEAGFENRRKKGVADDLWVLLRLLASHRGELGTGDEITTKPGKLKQKVSELRDRLRALLALAGDPFHSNRKGQPYRARFAIRSAGPATFPTPPGANWDDISVTEVAVGLVEVSVTGEARGVAFVSEGEEGQSHWEGSTEAGERGWRFAFADLGLVGADGNSAGEALVAILRAEGRVKRPTGDAGLLALGGALTRFFQLTAPPFEFEAKRSEWVAQFEASSVVAGSDR
jgi:hypothetical protein